MNIGEAERELKKDLSTIYSENEAAIIASIFLGHVTSLERIAFRKNKNAMLTDVQIVKMYEGYKRLMAHEPIQYVTNNAPFYGLDLFVDPSVLIPRPETEELVEWILKDMKEVHPELFESEPAEADETKTLKILDVGTGSGCIALALKKNIPKAEVWGCDINEKTLNIARRNGSHLDIRVDFQGVDFLDEAQHAFLPTVDILVSNPPYIPSKDKDQMDENVVKYEPYTALFVPDDDVLIFYKALARFGKNHLYEKGSLYVETHEDLGDEVVTLFKKEGYREVELKKDMQGKNRMVKGML